MSHSHVKQVCSCGTTIQQCRCMDPNKTTETIKNGCKVCQAYVKKHPPKEESPAAVLDRLGDDALKWAEAFCVQFPDHAQAGIDVDDMLAWFANAIEHSWDIRAGNIHNGDHAEYLLENDKVVPR